MAWCCIVDSRWFTFLRKQRDRACHYHGPQSFPTLQPDTLVLTVNIKAVETLQIFRSLNDSPILKRYRFCSHRI